MSPKERYDKLLEETKKPLPHYQDVIRQEHIKAINQANEKPVLDLDDLCN